jgi:hypothetical protein
MVMSANVTLVTGSLKMIVLINVLETIRTTMQEMDANVLITNMETHAKLIALLPNSKTV